MKKKTHAHLLSGPHCPSLNHKNQPTALSKRLVWFLNPLADGDPVQACEDFAITDNNAVCLSMYACFYITLLC